MGEEYDVLVSHIATGPFYRASVRILTKGEDKIPDLTASNLGTLLSELNWVDRNGKKHIFERCNGTISYAIIPSSQPIIN